MLWQVGTDELAQNFLAKLDTDSRIGRLVDCTSSFEQEQAEYLQQSGTSAFFLGRSKAKRLDLVVCIGSKKASALQSIVPAASVCL